MNDLCPTAHGRRDIITEDGSRVRVGVLRDRIGLQVANGEGTAVVDLSGDEASAIVQALRAARTLIRA